MTTTATIASPVTVVRTITEYTTLLERCRASGSSVGVVPTMGALHAGHRSLIARAASECDVVAVSIFVNPTQFGNPDDLARYPCTWDSDLDGVASAGGQVVFAPTVVEMYPDGTGPEHTMVPGLALADRLEGASRPGHFDGVATVVAKLLSAAGTCRAYFGEKDFQQLAVVRRVVRQLSLPVEVVGCETVREPDGLALSSRNVRLTAHQRAAAPVLHRALLAGAASIASGERRPEVVEAAMADVAATEASVALDYAAVVDADTLDTLETIETVETCACPRTLRLLVAATFGPVRLIDNLDPGTCR